MSEVKVNKISPRTNCGTVTLGDSGDTFTIPSGATISNSGTATGFGPTGAVDWQTGSIKTGTFTAATGEGYFANTTSGGFTMNLPAGSAGNIVSVVDYTNTFASNNLTVTPNGSEKIGGTNASATLSTEGQSVTFVYVDGTEGWKNVQDSTSNVIGETFVTATVSGACNTLTTAPCCANIKVATFVGPGTFCVSSISTTVAENTVGYTVVAGGGAGGSGVGGGGGAGGYREGRNATIDNFTASPLVANSPTNAITLSASPYPITVGGGGAGIPASTAGTTGSPSTFDSITSAGGGGGSSYAAPGSGEGLDGGSGGGGGYIFPGAPGPHATPCAVKGVGNTPPTTPPQGNTGGKGFNNYTPTGATNAAGGGGAGAIGVTPGGNAAGNGGCGVASSVTGASVTRGGGGGGGTTGVNAPVSTGGTGGPGGGGAGGTLPAGAGVAGTTNLGGGGGGGSDAPGVDGANGGSGVVVIRYKFQ
jgi:hypothetical protein